MKTLTFLLVLGVNTTMLAADSAPGSAKVPKKADAQSTATGNGYWCRASNGSWIRMPPNTLDTKTSNADSPVVDATGAIRAYSYYRPNVVTSYPNDFRPQVINDVSWYLNGRSYFSD